MRFFLSIVLALLLAGCATVPSHISWYKENGKWGLCDSKGQILVEPQFDKVVTTYYFDSYMVGKGGLYGVIDGKGDTLLPFVYESIDDCTREGLLRVKQNGKYGFVDFQNKVVIPIQYESLDQIPENIFLAQLNGYYGVLDSRGEILVPHNFELLRANYIGPYFEHGNPLASKAFVVKADGVWGFIDYNGQWIIPNEYDNALVFSDGIGIVKKNGLWGGVNEHNEIVIPFEYGQLSPFYCGVAEASKGPKSVYINTQNQVLSNFDYNLRDINEFGGYYHSRDSLGYIDTSGAKSLIARYNIQEPEWGNIQAQPSILPDNSQMLWWEYDTIKWTLPKLLGHMLEALRTEPATYGDYPLGDLAQVCIGYGFGLSGGNYSEDFMEYRKGWDGFKKQTVYKILGSEKLRQAAWVWAKPYIKASFQSMHPFHQQVYRNCASYLANYMGCYNKQAVKEYLKRDERRFAHYNLTGQKDPYRKLSAFVDRLIVLHRVINEQDARKWIADINTEVKGW